MANSFAHLHDFVLSVSKLNTSKAILQKTAQYCAKDLGATTATVFVDKNKAPEISPNRICFQVHSKKQVEGHIVLEFRKKLTLSFENQQKINLYSAISSLALRKLKRRQEVHHLEESKRLFISLMSHEIRTPLTAIYGYSQLLGKSTSNLTENQGRWVQSLYFETARMTTMLEEMLQLYQLQDDTFEIFKQKSSLNEIIESSVKRFKMLYPNIDLQVDNTLVNDASIIGDTLKLTQVITNLLANAAKFSRSVDNISLSITQNKSWFIIQVIDSGEGMTQKEFDQLLQVLQQSSDLSKIKKGLSLFIAKEIIAAHKGSITINTQKHKGTTITVKLPKN